MNSVLELIEDIRAGKMVILVDDENRENEGDLILAADFATPQAVNFMAREARGLICMSLTKAQIERLELPQMVQHESNLSPNQTAFTVSIEASTGVSTGISAADRSHTIRVASRPNAKPSDVITPGHIFPIKAQTGGVLKRAGHTEASMDLARMAGLNPAAVICEIMNEDGTMARYPDLKIFAEKHKLKIGTIESLIEYRLETESFVTEVSDKDFPTRFGTGFRIKTFKNNLDNSEHQVVYKGQFKKDQPSMVRVQVRDISGDVFGSLEKPSWKSIERSLSLIDQSGHGALVYLRQSMGDQKDYGVGAQILSSIGLNKIQLLSNSPSKKVGLKGFGIEIVDCISIADDAPGVRRLHELN